MTLVNKILSSFVLILGLLSLYYYYQLVNMRKIVSDKIYYLKDNITLLRTKVSSQDEIIHSLKNTSLPNLLEDDVVTSSSSISSVVRTDNRKGDVSDYKYKSKYKFYEVRFSDGPPIGYVMVYNDGSYVSKIYDYEIVINNVLSKGKNGKLKSYATVSIVLKKSGLANRKNSKLKDWKNIPYPLKVVDGQTIYNKDYVDYNRLRFKVRPTLSGSIKSNKNGSVSVSPSIGASFVSYGTRNRPRWKFLNVSLGHNKKFFLDVIPVMVNVVGRNTYIGPSISIDDSMSIKAGVSASLGF